MDDSNLQIGDKISIFIDRKSKRGNLICRRYDQFHVQETDEHFPKPGQRWLVEISKKIEGGIYILTPIEQEEVFKRDAPEPPKGDGSSPFKQKPSKSNGLMRGKQ